MSRAMWILAVGGSIVLFVKLGTAQDRSGSGRSYLFNEPAQRRSYQYFPRSGGDESPTETSGPQGARSAGSSHSNEVGSWEETGPRRPSRFTRRSETDLFPPSRSATQPPASPEITAGPTRGEAARGASESRTPEDRSSTRMRELRRSYLDSLLRQPGQEQPKQRGSQDDRQGRNRSVEQASFGQESSESQTGSQDAASQSSTVIHAEYQRADGASERGQIRQIRADEHNVSPVPGAAEDRIPASPSAESNRSSNSDRGAKQSKTDSASRSASSNGSGRSADSAATYPQGDGRTSAPLVTARWVQRSPINVGQECELHLILSNSGSGAAEEVVVDAYFPSSVRLTQAEPEPIEKQDHLAWQLDSLAPGAEQVIRVHMIPSRRGELTTNAAVRFTGAASGSFTVDEPLLAVKLKGPNQVMLGDPASQIILVSNPGSGVATNVTIEAVIPEGLEHPRGERLLMQIGSLSPGESRMVRLGLAAVQGGEHPVNVEVTADAGLKKTLQNAIQVIAPSVQVALDGPKLRYLGRSAQYVLSVTNDGAAASNNVRVVHEIPEGFEFIEAGDGGSYDDLKKSVTWFVGRLEPGESRQLSVELAADRLGSFVHRARAISEHGASAQAELESQIDGTPSLVLEIVDVNDPVEVGRETAYEVLVRNEGSKEARGVAVVCEIPAELELLDAAGPADFRATEGRVEFKPLGTLPAGKTAIYRVQVKGNTAGHRRFRARLTSDSVQEPLTVEEGTKFYGE